MGHTFPFSAIVGQDEMKLAILIAAIDPSLGGVLVLGDRGTGKSTAVRALADLLPPIQVVKGCPYKCDPQKPAQACPVCQASQSASVGKAAKPQTESRAVSVVDLPLGATEDRIVGALDLEKALSQGIKEFSPGLLAQAHRGFAQRGEEIQCPCAVGPLGLERLHIGCIVTVAEGDDAAGGGDDAFLKHATDELHAHFEIRHVTLQVVREPFMPLCGEVAPSR